MGKFAQARRKDIVISKTIVTKSAEETTALGERLARELKAGDIICLFGDLGSGKTTFVKGLAAGLQAGERQVVSPTFVLMNCYEGRLPLFHFDLYRLEDTRQIAGIGYDEFLYGDGVAVVEWAEHLAELMPAEYLHVALTAGEENERELTFTAKGERYDQLLECFL